MSVAPVRCRRSLLFAWSLPAIATLTLGCTGPNPDLPPDLGDEPSDAATIVDSGGPHDRDGALPPGDMSSMLPPLGPPIVAAPKTWTWIDFPDAVCDDGTTTGIGVNLAPDSKGLLIFLNGGGACWDYDSCAVSNSSTHGPFGDKQFQSTKLAFDLGSILDRKQATPYRDFNMVFVPYCTGDVHVGDNTKTYDNGAGKTRVIHHAGRPNLIAFLKRLAATVPSADKLVVSGSSAGGFGAALNYDLVRTYFPAAKSYLIDDSGPPMIGDAIPKSLRDLWYSSWNLNKTLSPICPDCGSDFSTLVPILAKKYPSDRMSLLSNNQDGVIRSFFGNQSGAQFQTNLYEMATKLIEPQPNFHYYFVAGTGHTFLFTPGLTAVKGVTLLNWLTQQGSDDPMWSSIKP